MQEALSARMLKKISVFTLIAVFMITSAVVPAARAKMIDTSVYLESQQSSVRSQMQALLARDDVREQMTALGVDPEDAAERLAALTDQEVSQLRDRIGDLPAGSGVLSVLGVVLVVLIVLELVGVINVFNRL